MKKTGLKEVENLFFVDYNAIDTSNILDIYSHLMKQTGYKIMFEFVKVMFVGF